MANELSAILFGFLQACFTGTPAKDVAPDFEGAISEIAKFNTLRAETVMNWPSAQRVALKDMLESWIIIIETAEATGIGYVVPAAWIAQASSRKLSEQIVAEILRRSDALILQSKRRYQGGE